jgi:hypothetical protein
MAGGDVKFPGFDNNSYGTWRKNTAGLNPTGITDSYLNLEEK